ncbi:MAG TPA: hypothetical protein VGR14_01350 [Verrucomicrobiae bacterium]|jgi:hypothetical protein|nr:hypothetical protein [Verrucomicrobiae bacterium]
MRVTTGVHRARIATPFQRFSPCQPSQVFAGHYVDYNPYDPISYAQNNTGRGA